MYVLQNIPKLVSMTSFYSAEQRR